MDTHFLKQMIAVVRKEEERRLLLTGENLDAEYDRWLDTDEPFVNELYLIVLVALRHQVERELVGLAARASNEAREISRKEYEKELLDLKTRKGKGWNWDTIEARLSFKSWKEYSSWQLLKRLADSYNHDPSREPDSELLNSLELKTGFDYARLQESPAVRERLAISVKLERGAGYCDIAARFVDIASEFLADGQARTKVRPFKREPISLVPAR